MAQKIDPLAWRLRRSEDYRASWLPNIRDYPLYSTRVSLLRQYIERYHRGIVRFEIALDNPGKGRLDLKLLRIEDLNKGSMLGQIRSWAFRRLGLVLSINAAFYDKRDLDPYSLAEQIRNQIEGRLNPMHLVSHFLKLAEGDPKVRGLRIIVKGRWKASNKTKKMISQYGSTKVQSMDIPVEYALREGVGKFGCFCVRVFVSRDV